MSTVTPSEASAFCASAPATPPATPPGTASHKVPLAERRWPAGGFTRIPAWVYSDQEVFEKEMETFFCGPTWHYIGLECELPEAGSYRRVWIGTRQVIAVKAEDGSIGVFDNRCPHRGGAICWSNSGNAGKSLTCPYHQWNYTLKGELTGVPFRRGFHGEGGMPADFDPKDHHLHRLRSTVRGGVMWATFSDTAPEFADYCGPDLLERLDRLMPGRPLRLLGYTRQLIPANWKLYFENTRDPYHGTLLHTFFVTFGLYRVDSHHRSGSSEGGRHSVIWATPAKKTGDASAEMTRIRTDLKLNDMDTVRHRDEIGDGQMSAVQVFPGVMVQQHANTLAMRSFIPKSAGQVEVSWTFFGYADDTEEMNLLRLKQGNLLGPSGFVSIDDSELLKEMQTSLHGYPDSVGMIEMGGRELKTQQTMATEVVIRGFYDFYRRAMGF